MRRVVVTGIGVISPLGNDLKTFRKRLKAGEVASSKITRFDTAAYSFKKACEVQDFDPHTYRTHIMDPFIQYAIAATYQAVADAKVEFTSIDPYRIGISVSSSKGGVHTKERFEERFRRHPSAILGARIFSNIVPNYAAQWIARRWKLRGPAKCYIAACATGTVACMEGARMVRDGTVDYCISGASDASIVPLMLAGYYNMKAMSKTAMKPFDQRRDGFLVGEGSGILLLETLESAKARGAKIYGELLEGAYGSDGTDILNFSHKESALSRVALDTLKKNQLDVSDIDYVNLHGTATKAGDIYETEQVKKIFKRQVNNVSMSATKSMTGHMLGASGTIEIISSLIAMNDGFIPPTAGLEKADELCDLDYTANKSREATIDTAMTWSMGFGGHLACLAMRRI